MVLIIEPIIIDVTVNCSPAHAFATFTARASTWWPSDHTISQSPLVQVTFEPVVGGRIFEQTPDGGEDDWGEILVWDPPHRLVYTWHLGTERADATEVEIIFTANGVQTDLRVEHRNWQRLGTGAQARRDANRSGWWALISALTEACDQRLPRPTTASAER